MRPERATRSLWRSTLLSTRVLEAKLRDSRTQAEKDTRGRSRAWLNTEFAALKARVVEARAGGRTYVGKITDELRASLNPGSGMRAAVGVQLAARRPWRREAGACQPSSA